LELIHEALQMAELVCGKVRGLPLPSFRKKTLLEDCERALVAIRIGDFAVALFNINVLADKLDTLREKGVCILSAPLFADLHRLQQLLLKLPLKQEGPPGPPGPPGPRGPEGPPGDCCPPPEPPPHPTPCPPVVCKETGGLLQNTGFECYAPFSRDCREMVQFDGWNQKGAIGVTTYPEDVHTLCAAAILGDYGELSQVVELKHHWNCHFFEFSFFAKSHCLGGSLVAELVFLDRREQQIQASATEIMIYYVPPGQYQYYRLQTRGPVPENACKIEVLLKNPVTGRKILIDDAALNN
jgi:hypothetical protein